jgi:hypothetical protein
MNTFVLRKKGTNNCITSDKNNKVILRDCEESILQRPNTTIFQGSAIKNDGVPGNLHTIMYNPKNKNTSRDAYKGVTPYDEFINDISNDVVGIDVNTNGTNFQFITQRKTDKPRIIMNNNKLFVNNAGTPAKISSDNYITKKFGNNRYATDIVQNINQSLDAVDHPIGIIKKSFWNDIIDKVKEKLPFLDKVSQKLNVTDYKYSHNADLTNVRYNVTAFATEDDITKLVIMPSQPQPLAKFSTPTIDGVTYKDGDIIAIFTLNSVNQRTDLPRAPRGIYRITGDGILRELITNKDASDARYNDNGSLKDYSLQGVIFYVNDGIKHGKKYYKIKIGRLLNNYDYPVTATINEIKENVTITDAKDDIYNYQDDPEIGILYDRTIPRPNYNYFDKYNRALNGPTVAPNENHPYFHMCPSDQYCMESCYGIPDNICREKNKIKLTDRDINDYIPWDPDAQGFDLIDPYSSVTIIRQGGTPEGPFIQRQAKNSSGFISGSFTDAIPHKSAYNNSNIYEIPLDDLIKGKQFRNIEYIKWLYNYIETLPMRQEMITKAREILAVGNKLITNNPNVFTSARNVVLQYSTWAFPSIDSFVRSHNLLMDQLNRPNNYIADTTTKNPFINYQIIMNDYNILKQNEKVNLVFIKQLYTIIDRISIITDTKYVTDFFLQYVNDLRSVFTMLNSIRVGYNNEPIPTNFTETDIVELIRLYDSYKRTARIIKFSDYHNKPITIYFGN